MLLTEKFIVVIQSELKPDSDPLVRIKASDVLWRCESEASPDGY